MDLIIEWTHMKREVVRLRHFTQKTARSGKYGMLRIMEDRVIKCNVHLIRKVSGTEEIFEEMMLSIFEN